MLRLTQWCLAGLTAFVAAGCIPVYEERMRFDTGNIADEAWTRHKRECLYEAKKATASAPVNIAEYRAEDLYVMCLESRGAKYHGKTQVRVQ
jgi:hypothetical protein